MPKLLKERLEKQGKDPGDLSVTRELYEGIFSRIKKAYDLDYYWFWTPESWTWKGAKPEQVKATLADLDAGQYQVLAKWSLTDGEANVVDLPY